MHSLILNIFYVLLSFHNFNTFWLEINLFEETLTLREIQFSVLMEFMWINYHDKILRVLVKQTQHKQVKILLIVSMILFNDELNIKIKRALICNFWVLTFFWRFAVILMRIIMQFRLRSITLRFGKWVTKITRTNNGTTSKSHIPCKILLFPIFCIFFKPSN